MCRPKRKKGGTFQDESNTCWWKYLSRAGAGQPSCNKEKWLIIRNCCIMHAEMLSAGWKTVTAPNQYDYLLGAVVPIGYGSNGSAKLKNNFTLISLSIVSTAHRVSEEFWSHWLIMERFNAVWMVNRNTAARGQTQSESGADISDNWTPLNWSYSAASRKLKGWKWSKFSSEFYFLSIFLIELLFTCICFSVALPT